MVLSFRQFRNLGRNLRLSGNLRNPQKRSDTRIFPPVFSFKPFQSRGNRNSALEVTAHLYLGRTGHESFCNYRDCSGIGIFWV